ncbi:MAG: phosphate signaling complex protein PhoU [bacterium]
MLPHLIREIENLKKKILYLSCLVEESVFKAVKSLEKRDAVLAQQVIEADTQIDKMEICIEEDCLKMLALYQPVAVDLRFIVVVLKINNDLERVGDLAVNIAKRAVFIAKQKKGTPPFDFPSMSGRVQMMLRKSLEALVNMDDKLAGKIYAEDDEVDTMNREAYQQVKQRLLGPDHDDPDFLLQNLSVSRYLERIADLATNIAEDVIYMVTGNIVRHRSDDYILSQ